MTLKQNNINNETIILFSELSEESINERDKLIAVIFNSNDNSQTNTYNITEVGHNDNGTVYKIVAGNASSNDTVGVILGVHSREHEIHEAINKTIHNITHSEDKNLTKKFVIYYVKVNDNLTSRDDTRPAGELLANKFVVNNRNLNLNVI